MGTIKLNANAGGSVSLQVDSTMTSDETIVIDERFGTTSGSNANGYWIKYPDGTLICTKRHTETVAVTTANGSLFRSPASSAAGWTYPETFIAEPVVTATVSSEVRTEVVGVRTWYQYTTSTKFILTSTVSIASYDAEVNFVAIGRWKA